MDILKGKIVVENKFAITREIGIDAGHRVPLHGSKCRNLHGHRYKVHATVEGILISDGEEQGMVMDFGFLKEYMMEVIDAYYDHALILYYKDSLLECFYSAAQIESYKNVFESSTLPALETIPGREGAQKIVLTKWVPTAENLARIWYDALSACISNRSGYANIRLQKITVWETPNCSAVYPA